VDVAVGREARLMAQRNKKGRLRIREAIERLRLSQRRSRNISDRLEICRSAFQISPRGAGPASHGAAWQTASTLFPSGSKTKAP
jgi:hypothetical protein